MSDSLRDALEKLTDEVDSDDTALVNRRVTTRIRALLAAHPAEPAGVSDEAVDAVARVLAEQFAKNPPVNGSKDFRIDARAVLNILGGAK